jgi:hypothetical protein
MNESEHQGKFHLLAIFLIPALLVSFFLSDSWWPFIVCACLAFGIVWWIFGRK